MIKLLSKIFVKDYENYFNQNVRTAYGKLCGVIGIISNFIICVAKVITGLLISSVSIMADGINNLADALSSVITLIGFKVANKPADSSHPFGHQRIEYISGLIVSFIIIIIGLILMKSSIEKIISRDTIEVDNIMKVITIVILTFSILVKAWQSYINKYVGKKINSIALIATSSDSLNDVLSTSVVLISLILSLIFPRLLLDGYMGVIVAIFIIYSGIKLVIETISPLIGEAPQKDFMDLVTNKILSYNGVLGMHDLVIHSYGPAKIFITVHVEVDSRISINSSHETIDKIESDFMKDLGYNVVIHMDPIDLTCEKTINLRSMVTNILFSIDEKLHFHDFRTVLGDKQINVLFDLVIPFGYKKETSILLDEIKEKANIEKEEYQISENLNFVVTIDREYIGRE